MSKWVNKPLGSLATYINGHAFKPQDWKQTGLPIIRIENLNNPKAVYNYFQGEIDNKYIVEKGNILVSWSASLDAYIWQSDVGVLNQHIFKVLPNEDIVDRDFLFYLLKKAIIDLKELVHGATMKHINRPEFEGFLVTLPESIEEQKEIAATLNSQLTETQKVREAVEVQLRELNQLKIKLQEKAMDILQDIPRLPLEHFLEGIEAGKSIKTTELPARKDELGVLKVSAVSWDKFQSDEAKAIKSTYEPKESHRVKKGDLIISRANTIELVGAIVLVQQNYPYRLLSDKTLRLVISDKARVDPEYLLQILKLSEARNHIEGNATGTSDSMRNISQKTINKIPIPDADVDKQMEVIKLFKDTSEFALRAEESLRCMLEEIKLLPSKLLNEAFELKEWEK